MKNLDLSSPIKVHVVGVGGAGMGSIASVLVAMGHNVTGSDLKHSPIIDRLRAEGVDITIGHDPSNVGDASVVAISSAISKNNLEVLQAKELGIPVLRRCDILPAMAAGSRTIAVAGTHGKTTISSMLSLIMIEAGLNPSFIIGGDVNEIGTGSSWGSGEWFVVEADESDRTFLSLNPELALVSSVEPDHLEAYKCDVNELHNAFKQFLCSATQKLVCADDPVAARIGKSAQALTYGTAPDAYYQMTDVSLAMPASSFDLNINNCAISNCGLDGVGSGLDSVSDSVERLGRVEMPIPGVYNARNAAASVAAAMLVGVPFAVAAKALARFGGVTRRFEFRGEAAGVTFVDDYAHLPSEVSAVLEAANTGDWQRIVCVFQPHRYSRVASIGADFTNCFVGVDELVITDIYSAGEPPRLGVTSKIIVDTVKASDPSLNVIWLRKLDEVVDWLAHQLRPGDLCITLGAGDSTSLPDMLIERIRGRC